MMNRLLTLLGAASIALVTMVSSAHANTARVRVKVDNLLDPSYENAKSTGTLEVCIVIGTSGTTRLCQTRVLDVTAPNFPFSSSFEGFSIDVTKVTLRFHGPGDTTDLLIVDELSLWDDSLGSSSLMLKQWGTDNSTGFCFSTQVADLSNSHCSSGSTIGFDFTR